MKVTKIVREFVEEEINKKYPMPELDGAAAAQLDKDIDAIKARIKEEAGILILNELREAGIQLDESVAKVSNVSWSYCDETDRYTYGGIVNHIKRANEEACRIVKEKRERALKDILVNLELGGTKKELMEMLANLPD